jgi:hypothetical protein
MVEWAVLVPSDYCRRVLLTPCATEGSEEAEGAEHLFHAAQPTNGPFFPTDCVPCALP